MKNIIKVKLQNKKLIKNKGGDFLLEELKGLKRKIEKLKEENDNRLNKVIKEIDVTNESIIFFEKKLYELNNDKQAIGNFKKVKKEIINTIILAFFVLVGITLIESGIELITSKYLLNIIIRKFLIIQLTNISFCTILSVILTSQIKKKFKCKDRKIIDKEIEKITNELSKSKNKLEILNQRKKDLENINLNLENNSNNKVLTNFVMEENNKIHKQKVKK